MPDRDPRISLTPGVDLLDALDEWDLVMRQLNRSPATRKIYATAVRQLDDHQRRPRRPDDGGRDQTGPRPQPTSSTSSTARAPRRR